MNEHPTDSAAAAHGLEKAVWTHSDFEQMGWHDATVRALAIPPELSGSEFILDIDYIVQWVKPSPPAADFQFWVAPATLIFMNVWSIDGEIVDAHDLTIDALRHEAPVTERQRHVGVSPWVIDGHSFVLRLLSSGFQQVFRSAPVLSDRQSLSDGERGGISFARAPFV